MELPIQKIPSGLMVDGIKLRKGKCGCESSIAKCCYSWSKVKQKGPLIQFEAKMTSPDTQDNYVWGYTVRKNGTTVTVRVDDARDKEIYSGYIPPPASEWEDKGWEVVEKDGDREDGAVWSCAMCKWLYNDNKEGKSFERLPEEWKCPTCGSLKKAFKKIG